MERSGSLPDGAFERFVTSALAAIITIVFSWRLLAEGQLELQDETNRPRFQRAIEEKDLDIDGEKEKEPPKTPVSENILKTEAENTETTAPEYATLATDNNDSGEGDGSLWGEYSWEEDMYDTVHTRRHVRDFVKRSSESSSDEHEIDDIQLSPIPASHEMLEKLYMNQEYQSIVDDEGQSDSSDSDDEDNATEGVYEPPDMEADMYFSNGLEPIIEEDSDDLDSSENENYDENNEEINERTYCKITSDIDPERSRQDLVEHKVTQEGDLNASLSDSDSSLPDIADENKSLLDNFIEECFDKCIEDSDGSSDDSDSLPPSPIIRTCAIDDDYANLSDESCSSGSVITVVSVKSDYSDTPEIQMVEDSNKPMSFMFTDNESNIPDNLEPLKGEDIMAFIHGDDEKHDGTSDLDKTPDNDLFDEFVEDKIKTTQNELDYQDFIKDIKAVSETNTSSENTEENEKGDEIEEQTLSKEETCVQENDLVIQEETEVLCANQLENDEENDEMKEFIEKLKEKSFDDDEGPREYNPYEDDFAEFEYCDSDDDSFYLVVGDSNKLPNFKTFNAGDSGNLRNFDTFDSLDTIGLSPGLDSSCESGMSDDGRFIFSRTENIGTEYKTRFYSKDKELSPILQNSDTPKTETSEFPGLDLAVENKNTYNESRLQNADSVDPIITDLENIELFIDETKIPGKESEEIKMLDNSKRIVDEECREINYSKPLTVNDEPINNSLGEIHKAYEGQQLTEIIDINGNNKDENLSISNKVKQHEETEEGVFERLTENKNTPLFSKSKSCSENSSPISNDKEEFENSMKPCLEILSKAHDSGIDLDSDSGKLDTPDSDQIKFETMDNSIKNSNSKLEILNMIHSVKGHIDRSAAIKPSHLKGNTKTKIQHQQQKQRSKSYVSVLQQPMTSETPRSVTVVLPEKNVPKSRQQIIASRKRFLSEQNLISNEMQDKFNNHKTSFEQVSQRKPRYVRRGNSLPRSTRRRTSYDKLDFNSLNSSQSSVEKPEICTLHENCIFSPQKHQEILNRTLSIDNLESRLMRYGSVTSLVETDIDSGETTEYQIFTDFENDFEFQLPLERTASMSELATRKKNKSESKGRFSDRNAPKSKSLCTLETNIDDVDETPCPGTLGRVPSVHELRVSKSLQKLNVPDWYKKSSVSRSGSTWSLYTTPRKDSFSSYTSYAPSITSSPCPSVSLGSNSVVIRTRITPSSAKLFRSPKLQTTPEKSPTPISVQLPSEKLRQKEKPKELMPIPIVPFTKLRLMFEESSRKSTPTTLSTSPPSTSPACTPTSPIPPTEQIQLSKHVDLNETAKTRPTVPAKPILKKPQISTTENKNVGRVEPQQTSLSVQPMSTSPRGGRRVETTFNGSVGHTEVRKAKETTFECDKPVQVVKPEVQEQKVVPQKSAENQNEHNSKSGRYSSLSKSLKSAFRRPQKSSAVEAGGSKIETTV